MRVIKNLIGIILTGLIIFIVVCFVVHRSKVLNSFNDSKPKENMKQYNTGEYRVNIKKAGPSDSKYHLVVLSDYKEHDLSIQMDFVTSKLESDYEIVFVDRAGYGFSEDSTQEQNIDRIVLAYRNALMNAGVTNNYILVAHGYSGVYATYWQNNHPKEVKGVIFLDSRVVDGNISDLDTTVDYEDYLNLIYCKLGLHRLHLTDYYTKLPSKFDESKQELVAELNASNTISSAILSEKKLLASNQLKAFNGYAKNEIPKIYVESTYGFRDKGEIDRYIKWYNQYAEEVGLSKKSEPTELEKENTINNNIKYHNEVLMPYIESLGNTEVVLLPSDSKMYYQKPGDLANIIKKFMNEKIK